MHTGNIFIICNLSFHNNHGNHDEIQIQILCIIDTGVIDNTATVQFPHELDTVISLRFYGNCSRERDQCGF